MSLENVNTVLDKQQVYDACNVIESFIPVYIALQTANDIKLVTVQKLE